MNKHILPPLFFFTMLLFCIFSTFSMAQNYSPVIDGNTSLFMVEFDGDFALHVDSMNNDPKGIAYHFSKRWAANPSGCNDYEPHWAGAKCIVSSNACYFFTKDNDTVTFMPTATLGYTWRILTYPDSSYLEGTVKQKTIQSFCNAALSDSVAVISVQLKNKADVSMGVGAGDFIFSKNYGIIQFSSFEVFPALTYSYTIVPAYGTYTLQGLTNPAIGKTFFTPRTIFNFDVGDEFHYHKEESNPPSSDINYDIILHVIDVNGSVNENQVSYTFKRNQEIHTRQPSNADEVISYKTDTITETYTLNLPVYYPQQAITETNPQSFYYGMSSFDQVSILNGGIPTLTAHYNGLTLTDDCWSFQTTTNDYDVSYINGCGLYSSNIPNGMGYSSTDLVYYQKMNGAEWGNPLVLSNQTATVASSLQLFPNPVYPGQSIHYSSSFQATQFSLLDIAGHVLIHSAQFNKDEGLDTSDLKPGVYILQLFNEKNEKLVGKFFVR